jgi:hypothetical protein
MVEYLHQSLRVPRQLSREIGKHLGRASPSTIAAIYGGIIVDLMGSTNLVESLVPTKIRLEMHEKVGVVH